MQYSKSGYSILTPLTEMDANYLVYAKATYFPSFVSVYVPNEPYKIRTANLEERDTGRSKQAHAHKSLDSLDETNLERSIRLTKKKIKEYVLCNEFELFATFTFKEDRSDVDRCKTKMTNWLKNQRRRTGAFEYIIVSEFHKDGESIHFHGLLKNFQGKVEPSISARTGEHLRQGKRLVYELPGYTLGFTNVKKVDKDLDSQTKVGFYIQKYITKDMPVFFGKNRYRTSRGLRTPKTENNPEKWYLNVKPDRTYKVDNGEILEFNVGKHPLVDIFWEAKK